MNIILAGTGEVGLLLVKMLTDENHQITVIDADHDRLQYIDSHFDVRILEGQTDSIRLLKEAEVNRSDLFVGVSPHHEMNVISAILAKKLGARKTIARIDNPEYMVTGNKQFFVDMGIDSLIYPEKLAGNEVISLLAQTGTTEIVEFSGGLLSLYVIKLEEGAPIINYTMEEALMASAGFNYRAVAIHRRGKTIIPKRNDIFQVGDLVHVITNQEGIPTLMQFSGKESFELNNIMIIGGSRIGRRVARKMQKTHNIRLIEFDRERSLKVSEELQHSLVIHGDGRNLDLLLEEGVNRMDAVVAVTESSETNILSCLAAKEYGVRKTIAEIENIDYIGLAENINVDTIINKKLITASHIFSFTFGPQVESVKCLTGTDADVLEFRVRPGAKITRAAVKDIGFPDGATIGGVIRNNKAFIVKGDSLIYDNDLVVVFALPAVVQKVEKFFD